MEIKIRRGMRKPMAVNAKYSYKDFTGQTFTGVDPDEFSNSEIDALTDDRAYE